MARYTEAEGIEPIFISVKEAARALSISPWEMYKLCNDGSVDSRYQGRRRLVSVESLRKYAADLPNVQPERSA